MSQRNPEGSEYSATYGSAEVTLVDLIKAVLRRRKVFVVTFAVILSAGVVVALLKPSTYTFTSIYALANTGVGGKPLQEPAAALATVKSVYLPEQVEGYLKTRGLSSLPFRVTAVNPASTALIELQSRSSISHQEAVSTVQNAVLNQLESDDARRVAQKKAELHSQLSSLKAQLAVLKQGPGNSMAIASALQNKSEAEQQLSTLTPGRVVALAKRSVGSTSTAPSVIVAMAFLVGIITALFGVFVAELAAAVKADGR
ncbi:MAG: hypothetical protein P8180_03485 [Gammaproteobacteria bacterium]